MVADEFESVRIVVYPYVDEARAISRFKYCLYYRRLGGMEDRIYESPPDFINKNMALRAGHLKFMKMMGLQLRYIEQEDDIILNHLYGI